MAERKPTKHKHNFKDLTGQKFGRLTVIGRYDIENRKTYWHCQCECGKTVRARSDLLFKGRTRSCGCLCIEVRKAKSTTHGKSYTFEYETWRKMMTRCTNPKDKAYARYGGRGITVCERWHTFENFYSDMGERPPGGLNEWSIDRTDNNGPYSPENCRWATMTEQLRNVRTNHILAFQGRSQCIAAWSKELGVCAYVIYQRINHGWSVERALTEKVRRRR
jgi:hypothetical protein